MHRAGLTSLLCGLPQKWQQQQLQSGLLISAANLLRSGSSQCSSSSPSPRAGAAAAAAPAAQHFHTSSSCRAESDSSDDDEPLRPQQSESDSDAEQPEASSSDGGVMGVIRSSSSSSSSEGGAGSQRRYLGLDDPELNIYLRYNTLFKTDFDRPHSIGHLAAFEKNTRLELRKGLAAHRLQLRDQAAAAAAGPASASGLPLREQMQQRLAEMQDHLAALNSSSGGGSR